MQDPDSNPWSGLGIHPPAQHSLPQNQSPLTATAGLANKLKQQRRKHKKHGNVKAAKMPPDSPRGRLCCFPSCHRSCMGPRPEHFMPHAPPHWFKKTTFEQSWNGRLSQRKKLRVWRCHFREQTQHAKRGSRQLIGEFYTKIEKTRILIKFWKWLLCQGLKTFYFFW